MKTAYLRLLFGLGLILLYSSNGFSQNGGKSNKSSFALGADISGGIYFPSDLNKQLQEWRERQIIILQDAPPYRLSWGYNGYIAIKVLKFLTLKGELSVFQGPSLYGINNSTTTFQDPFTKDQLKLHVAAIIPQVTANFLLGNFVVGAGLAKGFAKIEWDDKVFDYQDNWYGNNFGLATHIGWVSTQASNFGWTWTLNSRFLNIEQMQDGKGREILFTQTGKNFHLDLTGVEIRLGIYCTF